MRSGRLCRARSDTERTGTLGARSAYSAAIAFVKGRIDVEGDLIAAIQEFNAQPRHPTFRWLYEVWARLYSLWPEAWYQTRSRARRNIQFHYDHDPEFYQQFLDQRLVYSCAYFDDPRMTLDQAQLAKLDLICRKLDMQGGRPIP